MFNTLVILIIFLFGYTLAMLLYHLIFRKPITKKEITIYICVSLCLWLQFIVQRFP